MRLKLLCFDANGRCELAVFVTFDLLQTWRLSKAMEREIWHTTKASFFDPNYIDDDLQWAQSLKFGIRGTYSSDFLCNPDNRSSGDQFLLNF